MIKKILLILGVVVVFELIGSGCASSPLDIQKDALTDSMRQDIYLKQAEPDLPSWATYSGMYDGKLVAVGVAEGKNETSPVSLKRAAAMDAESQLFSKAPHEYRELVQNATEGTGVNFLSIQTKLLKLHGVTGVSFPPSKVFCYKVLRDNGDYVQVSRVCYQQAVISVAAMNRTIERTIKQNYSEKKADVFKQKMDAELKKIEGEERHEDKQISDVPRASDILARMPSGKPDGLSRPRSGSK